MTVPKNVNASDWGDSEVGALNGESGEGLATLLIEVVKSEPGVKTICDLGCGNGYLAHRLATHGYAVTGVDASAPYIETARRLYSDPPVRFEQAFFGEALTETLQRESFDLVISSDVIEHLYHPKELLATAKALLKPGGTLVMCTPYHGYLKNLAIAALGKWDSHHAVHWDGGHIKFFSVATLRNLIEEQLFVPQRVVYYGRIPAFAKNMIWVARKPA